MKFALSDEQIALVDTTRDFFSAKCSSEQIRASFVSELGFDESLFAEMCSDLGLASLIVQEDLGGFGAKDIELGVVLEQHGYFLVTTPLRVHSEAIIAVDECASQQYRQEHLSRLVTGAHLAGVVLGNDDHSVLFEKSEHGLLISGRFARVSFGHALKSLYFFSEVDGSLKLIHLDCNQDGVSQFVTPSIDQTIPLGAIECENAIITVVSENLDGQFERARSRAIITACNEMVGSTQATLDMSVAYAKDRQQFGRPIGSFQAIKHKCADMLLETESARSIALFGAWLASQGSEFVSDEVQDNLDHVASMAKYYCSKALNHAAGENIQIHGGIGFTMEHDAQLYFKRAAFMNAYLGLPSDHGAKISAHLLSL